MGRIVRAFLGTDGIALVRVVGPPEVGVNLPAGAVWVQSRGGALDNLEAGLETELSESDRVLICGADYPFLNAEGIADFLRRVPEEADIALPLVRKELFRAAFPGNPGIYVRLADGLFTSGGVLAARVGPMRRALLPARKFFQRRKSQLAMAGLLGWDNVGKLLAGRLAVQAIEERVSRIAGCRCRAVPDCRPELAFDVDTIWDLAYARRRLAEPPG